MRVGRAAALTVIGPFLAFSSALAPQHVHRGDHERAAVAHGHFAPHTHSAHDTTTEIEHDEDDGQLVWLDGAVLLGSLPHVTPPATALAIQAQIVAPVTRWSVTAVDESAPPHGPPKPVRRLRGPPSPRLS
jgi:hypothetical protein